MKFIFVCVTVCAIALSLSFDFVSAVDMWSKFLSRSLREIDQSQETSPNPSDEGISSDNSEHGNPHLPEFSPSSGNESDSAYSVQGLRNPHFPKGPHGNDDSAEHFSYEDVENQMRQQYNKLIVRGVAKAWLRCTQQYPVTGIQGFDLFYNNIQPSGNISSTRKCLVNCVMRKMHVMTNSGLDEDEYMLQIRKLRFNYTTYDVDALSSMRKTLLQLHLRIYSVHYSEFSQGDNCYTMDRTKEEFEFYCTELMKFYALAAQNCKSIRDPNNDSCETSWMTMRCMNDYHLQRNFTSPFYPLPRRMNRWNRILETTPGCGLANQTDVKF